MQNTFGLKDAVLYLLIIGAGVLVVLTMIQDDRRFDQMQRAVLRLEEHTQTLSRVQRSLDDLATTKDEKLQSVVVAIGSQLTDLRTSVDQTNAQLSAITSALGGELTDEQRAALASARSTAPTTNTGAASTNDALAALVGSGARDESWARPGIPVEWPAPQTEPSPPENFDDFAEGGEFLEVFEAQPKKMTPYLYQDVYGRRVIEDLVCECLGSLDPETLALRQGLAEAWQYAPDGMWLRVKINDRARFSDGMPVTAEDVKFTFEWVMDPRMDTERFRASLNMIDHIEVISDKVAEVHFKEPQFLNKMHALQSLPIIPRHFYSRFTPDQFNQSTGLLMGSGPYRMEIIDPDNQWSPPQDIILIRNENYWGHKPPIRRQRFTVIDDNIARLTNYENGMGHMIRASPDQFRTKSADRKFMSRNHAEQWTNMRSGFSFIAWNCGERNGKPTPFADKRVRRAMTHLIDRKRVLRDFYYGYGELALSPFPPKSPQNAPDIEPIPFDVERAKALLDEAGWIDRDGNGVRENEAGEEFEFAFTYATGSTLSPKIAKYLKDQCATVGIRMEEAVVDWSIYGDIQDERNFDAITMMWSHSLPESDPFQVWHSESSKNRGDNFAQYNNPEVDRLIELGRQTLDDDERMKIWHEVNRLIYDDQPYMFMVNAPWFRFIRGEVKNVHTYPIGLQKTEMYFAMPNP